MGALLRVIPFTLIAFSTGCAFFSPAAPHKPVEFKEEWSPPREPRFPNWPIPPDVAMRKIDSATYDKSVVMKSQKGAGAGTTGAKEAVVSFPDLKEDVHFKIKAVPGDLDGINNSPRKELAAYAIQHLFLDPEEYVVPATTVYCLHEDRLQQSGIPYDGATLKGGSCALVVVALWLEDLTLRWPVYDEARFLRDPAYAYYLSNLNVFTYIIGHRDGRKGNFLFSKNDDRPQLFAIDNGSTFNPWGFNYFVANWDVVRVAAVRKATIDRLRALKRADLDTLLVVAQMEIDSQGDIRKVAPGASIDDGKGALRRGDTIQFGLTKKEIDKVWKRIQTLKEQVDDGSLPVF